MRYKWRNNDFRTSGLPLLAICTVDLTVHTRLINQSDFSSASLTRRLFRTTSPVAIPKSAILPTHPLEITVITMTVIMTKTTTICVLRHGPHTLACINLHGCSEKDQNRLFNCFSTLNYCQNNHSRSMYILLTCNCICVRMCVQCIR